jgi:hypothetical protein
MSTDSDSVFIRSCTSGTAACSTASCSVDGSTGRMPSLARNGIIRCANSSGGSSRMCAALIASHFFGSNRAAFAFTLRMSNASIISAIVNTSRSSAIDQPSRAR